jgi:hypothetical protein
MSLHRLLDYSPSELCFDIWSTGTNPSSVHGFLCHLVYLHRTARRIAAMHTSGVAAPDSLWQSSRDGLPLRSMLNVYHTHSPTSVLQLEEDCGSVFREMVLDSPTTRLLHMRQHLHSFLCYMPGAHVMRVCVCVFALLLLLFVHM